jgi:CBS domain-containing protein
MRVSDIMTRDVHYTHPEATLQEAAAQMEAFELGALPVCLDGRIIGMITDRDMTVRASAEGVNPLLGLVRDFMTPGVITCLEDQLVIDVDLIMQESKVRRLVVLSRDHKMVGIVSLGDLARRSDQDQLTESTLEAVSGPGG